LLAPSNSQGEVRVRKLRVNQIRQSLRRFGANPTNFPSNQQSRNKKLVSCLKADSGSVERVKLRTFRLKSRERPAPLEMTMALQDLGQFYDSTDSLPMPRGNYSRSVLDRCSSQRTSKLKIKVSERAISRFSCESKEEGRGPMVRQYQSYMQMHSSVDQAPNTMQNKTVD
jgi:hypothetical protein